MGVFYGAYQKWGGGAGPQLWKKNYHFVRLLPFDSEYHNIFFEFICSELSKAQYIYQQVLFYWKCNFPMTPPIHLLVYRSGGWL